MSSGLVKKGSYSTTKNSENKTKKKKKKEPETFFWWREGWKEFKTKLRVEMFTLVSFKKILNYLFPNSALISATNGAASISPPPHAAA